MLGIFIMLLVSYLLLRWVGAPQNIYNYLPKRLSALEFCLGMLWPVIYYCSFEFTLAFLVKNPIILNPQYTAANFLHTLVYIARSVVSEELVFRGALFYLLWKKLGASWAVLISACCFGVYHWFSWQAFGSPWKMAIIFFATASVGLVLGYSFIRTRSLYLPIALHLGTNFSTMLVFSKDKTLGAQLLVKALENDAVVPSGYIGLPMLVLHFVGFQLITFLLVRWCTKADSQKKFSKTLEVK